MPRDLPLSNGELLINFDKSYNLRDIYWPHVGQELHTAGGISRTGVWVSGQFAWLDAPEWQREMVYEQETLVTHVTLTHPGLQLKLVFNDTVDFARPIFLRHVVVTNLADRMREVRLFFHYDWHIWADVDGNTVFYYPEARALVAYKASGYFLMNGQILQYPLADRRERENTMLLPTPPDARNPNATLLNMSSGFAIGSDTQAQIGISSWATGIKEFNGAEGTWRDAEDGELQRNPIAQGSVDGTLALHLPPLAAQTSGEAYHWLTAGPSLSAVIELDGLIAKRGIQTFLMRTYNYWYSWVNKDGMYFADLSPELVKLYKQSLLVLRTQIDNGGAIVAANDADVSSFSRDSYSYMWPRDGALVANALSHAGYSETSRNFYDFCNAVLTPSGYLLHKYNPDRSWGSSWHPWIDKDGNLQLPIQEDETALVLYSLWQHYHCFGDIEFAAPHYHSLIVPAADFLVSYRDSFTGLPDASHDLWEERRGILTYTTAAVYAGLDAAVRFSKLFGEEEVAAKYQQAATEIKDATLRYLWDEERGHFLRMINVDKDGHIHKDVTLDSSVCSLFQFGMFPAGDPHIERTMQALEQTLWVKTKVGGMARYENDYYHQVTQDLSQAQGNPWFICTLWLAQYRITHATTLDELRQAQPLLDWARVHALPSGVMAEQVNPFTSEPLSVSPLTWSHAEYVLTVRWYLGKYQRLQQA